MLSFCLDAWSVILNKMLGLRKEGDLVNLFPQYVSGEVSQETQESAVESNVSFLLQCFIYLRKFKVFCWRRFESFTRLKLRLFFIRTFLASQNRLS